MKAAKFIASCREIYANSEGDLGSALGSAIGGWALIFFNYQVLSIILGLMGIVAALIFYFLVIDPNRT